MVAGLDAMALEALAKALQAEVEEGEAEIKSANEKIQEVNERVSALGMKVGVEVVGVEQVAAKEQWERYNEIVRIKEKQIRKLKEQIGQLKKVEKEVEGKKGMTESDKEDQAVGKEQQGDVEEKEVEKMKQILKKLGVSIGGGVSDKRTDAGAGRVVLEERHFSEGGEI